MTPAEEKHIAYRAFLIRCWPVAGTLLLGLTLTLFWYLYQHYPLYVNQEYLLDQLRAYKVDNDTLDRMAVMGNMAFVACGAFIIIVLLLISMALWKEYKLIRIIREQAEELAALREELMLASARLDAASPAEEH